ncbi:MAG TPA: hypothetical protein VMT46_04200 [Anaerolineaceae bacterium]|nr:hypothetical protein [Anaerolineaceae bacterium]
MKPAYIIEIWVNGLFSPDWLEQIGEYQFTPQGNQCTLVQGKVLDQAAILGLLQLMHDLGMQILRANFEHSGEG